MPAAPADNPLLAAALAYAARGWHVFPLRPGDKRPAFPAHPANRCDGSDPRCRAGHAGWEQRATTDPDRIRRAWTARPYGIGIACGPSGLVVIDLDTPKDDQTTSGVRTFGALCEHAGQSVDPTQVAEWASHSVHVLLRVYAKCTAGRDALARRRIEQFLSGDDGIPEKPNATT